LMHMDVSLMDLVAQSIGRAKAAVNPPEGVFLQGS
jgi:hypothetical protein